MGIRVTRTTCCPCFLVLYGALYSSVIRWGNGNLGKCLKLNIKNKG